MLACLSIWAAKAEEAEMDSNKQLADMLAREGIRNCIVRLARGEDRRDAALISSAYWSDAHIDFGTFAGDFATYLGFVVPGDPALPCTVHFLGQTHTELDGDTARAETLVSSYHRIDTGNGHVDSTIAGRYLDTMALREGEWRIASRVMLFDYITNTGASADWSQGVMGAPFSAEHYSGRAHGDYSELFFGKRAG
jgi:SnoaL-like domain